MRTLSWLTALVVFGLWLVAPVAYGQTTTTTTVTTTTLTPNAGTCSPVGEFMQADAYHVQGTFTGTANYATGGMQFSATASAASAANCLCHSAQRTIRTVLFGSAGGYDFSYNATTFKVQAFTSGGTETSAATNLSTFAVPFISVCR